MTDNVQISRKGPKDNLARAVVCNDKVQVATIVATDMVNESIRLHHLTPLAAAALGRSLMAAVFLGINLKNEDTVTLRILGDGPIGGIIAQADAKHHVKGYVANPGLELPLNDQGKLDVGGAVGKGFMYVTRDLGLKEPYNSSAELVTGEIGEDLAHYFYQSEQLPVVVALGVLIDVDGSCKAAGGFLIKAMPGAEEENLTELEQWLSVLPPISALTDQLNDPAEILQALFPKEEPKGLTLENWSLHCDCNRERLEQIMIGLGPEELKDILEQDGKAELNCHFCNKTYQFDEQDLKHLLQESLKHSKG
jgi:molecular chaperone Hsp33